MVPHGARERTHGRCIRPMHWRSRSWISVATACAVGRAVGEQLSHAARRKVTTRVLEPSVPERDAWPVLLERAHVRGARGSHASAAVVVRGADALNLVTGILDEPAACAREMSGIERRVLGDVLAAMTPVLSPLCGQDLRPSNDADEFFTYFDILADVGTNVRIGIAATDVRPLRGGATLQSRDLESVEVEMRVELGRGELDARRLLDLRPGDVVPMTTKIGEPGVLRLGAGAIVARGDCGAAGSRFALMVR